MDATFLNSKDIVSQLENYEKKRPTKYFFNKILHDIQFFIFQTPKNYYNKVKYFIQRGKDGFSDEDCWSVNSYLSTITSKMVKRILKNKPGIPMEIFTSKSKLDKNGNFTAKAITQAEKRWRDILHSIIFTFETAENISEANLFYIPTSKYYKKEGNALRKQIINNKHFKVMSYQDCKKYELGWKNFELYFFDLWD